MEKEKWSDIKVSIKLNRDVFSSEKKAFSPQHTLTFFLFTYFKLYQMKSCVIFHDTDFTTLEPDVSNMYKTFFIKFDLISKLQF